MKKPYKDGEGWIAEQYIHKESYIEAPPYPEESDKITIFLSENNIELLLSPEQYSVSREMIGEYDKNK